MWIDSTEEWAAIPGVVWALPADWAFPTIWRSSGGGKRNESTGTQLVPFALDGKSPDPTLVFYLGQSPDNGQPLEEEKLNPEGFQDYC